MNSIHTPYYNIIFQDGPVKEHGVNGCQVPDILKACITELREISQAFPNRETAIAITKIEEALHWLDARTRDREARGVEGYSKA